MPIYRVSMDTGFRYVQYVEAASRKLALAIAAKHSNWENDVGKIDPYYDVYELSAEESIKVLDDYEEEEDPSILLRSDDYPVTEADIPWHRG